jgi:hypothetical protein
MPKTVSRTSRCRTFLMMVPRESPGNRVGLPYAYGEYLRWCREHEPGTPLALSTFADAVARWAPIERYEGVARPELGVLVGLAFPKGG